MRTTVVAAAVAALILAGCGGPGRPSADTASTVTATSASTDTNTVTVTRVIDGDTLTVSTGATIRLLGIDTPERGQCGYKEAAANLRRLTQGEPVSLTGGSAKDRYGRLVRYVGVGDVDAGTAQIEAGLAVARYDSRDGYKRHPKQAAYVAADAAAANPYCPAGT